ncbi:MAG: 5,6-dimethylbenzimidazole synthase [Alphaproteobacteria bacterium]|nr:5,6-dimethylbenzimidazole synthase [Alphaproteobacteria bacterium]
MPNRPVAPLPPVPAFDGAFLDRLTDLFLWRRDVRRFRDAPLADAVVDELLSLACLAPSVGNSQPWRFVKVKDRAARARIRASFESCNRRALENYEGERAKLYATLKLSGLDRAPVQIAVFAENDPAEGRGLGRATMPETIGYSVAMAVHTLWIAARARGVGVGWVSILDPAEVAKALDAPAAWTLVGYLCVGWPEEEHADPELERHGWQDRLDPRRFIFDK